MQENWTERRITESDSKWGVTVDGKWAPCWRAVWNKDTMDGFVEAYGLIKGGGLVIDHVEIERASNALGRIPVVVTAGKIQIIE